MEILTIESDTRTIPRTAQALAEEAKETIVRFPQIFDERLLKGLERLLANSSDRFVSSRAYFHLKRVLLAQFSLQRRMEEAIPAEPQKPLFLKLFRSPPSRICIAFSVLANRGIHKEQVIKALQGLLPSVNEVPGSHFLWYHPDLPYLFSYCEVQKLRGKDPSSSELRELEQGLLNQLLSISPLTPALFWPYNKEDSFRQIQLLQREMKSSTDLPQVSVHFQEQTQTTLEFLIHLVRPAGEIPLDASLKKLPNTFSFFSQYFRANKTPFPIEIGAFSIKIPSFSFEIRESINLLYARRFVLKNLEGIIGPFRDINGGLFEIQQQHFEAIRSQLSDKIPYFELFAEKVFYALHPVETWLALPMVDAESFFSAFSDLFVDSAPEGSRIKKGAFAIFKTPNREENLPFQTNREKLSHAQLTFGDSHFLCLIGAESDRAEKLFISPPPQQTLRLYFQEGPPPSLNPHYSSGDMRCRILNKLLFEGLTRVNQEGVAEPAGAENWECSSDGLIYKFQLRPTFWSNGEKVSAADYVSSWQSALTDSINHPEHLFILKGAKEFKEKKKGLGLRALDPVTLLIELEKPDPLFLQKLSQPFFFPLFGAMREPKWFNGPFLIRSSNSEGLLLDRNAYYWNAVSKSVDQIEFQWNHPNQPIFSLFDEGKIDWIGDPLTFLSPQQVHQLQEKMPVYAKPVRRRFSLYFNTRLKPLSSPSIRKAFSLAIDRSFICGAIFPGCVPLAAQSHQIDEAKEYFEEGLKELGLSRTNFPTITLLFSQQTRREKLAAYLQSTWGELFKIPIAIQNEEWNDFRNRLEERAFDICGTLQDTLSEGSLSYYERFEGDNSWNFSQWTHQGYRECLLQGKKEMASEAVKELERILEEETPFTPLFNYTHLYAHHPRLKGFWIDDEGCVDFSRTHIMEGLTR